MCGRLHGQRRADCERIAREASRLLKSRFGDPGEVSDKGDPSVMRGFARTVFHQENVERAEAFFARHGGKAVVLARFIPVIRTFTGPAGINIEESVAPINK